MTQAPLASRSRTWSQMHPQTVRHGTCSPVCHHPPSLRLRVEHAAHWMAETLKAGLQRIFRQTPQATNAPSKMRSMGCLRVTKREHPTIRFTSDFSPALLEYPSKSSTLRIRAHRQRFSKRWPPQSRLTARLGAVFCSSSMTTTERSQTRLKSERTSSETKRVMSLLRKS